MRCSWVFSKNQSCDPVERALNTAELKKKRHQWYAVLHKIAIPLSGQIGNMFENSII